MLRPATVTALLFLLSFLTACASLEGSPAAITKAITQTLSPTRRPTDTPQPPTAAATTILAPTPLEAKPTAGPAIATQAAPTWPSPLPLERPFARSEVTADEQATFVELAQAVAPTRDDLALARAYSDIGDYVLATPTISQPLSVGDRHSFHILNWDDNTVSQTAAVLLAVGEHAYFWFDTGPGAFTPAADEVAETRDSFDEIYERVVAIFGSENNPGLDGDPRIHVVNASPLALCDVTLETAANCGLVGYFSAADVLPAAVYDNSNEREMVVMNQGHFGANYYLPVLAHEFRHMIEDNFDKGDADWEVEGSAMLTEDLIGFPYGAVLRANAFLENPAQQLNRWSEDNTLPYYGQGYLLNRYLYDRLGPELYREFASSPVDGLAAVDSVSAAHGLPLSGHSIWLDWLVALAIHDDPNAPDRFRFGVGGLDTAAATHLSSLPSSIETTVRQYAADYYRLSGTSEVTIEFRGSALAPVLPVAPASGRLMWYANRANYSHARLSREVDLRGVGSATLHYAVYHEIEAGYDFAYASVSMDGGRTWQGLVAANMQGQAAEDDPSDSALTARFYSGRSQRWLEERADLTPYAGQRIRLRFDYVTDPILTSGGLALDNIAIPEIGFYDDVEAAAPGWLVEGFSRVTAQIPQRWHLQLVTYPDGAPLVQQMALAADNSLSMMLALGESSRPPILIVAATAPMTLEEAHYRLEVR